MCVKAQVDFALFLKNSYFARCFYLFILFFKWRPTPFIRSLLSLLTNQQQKNHGSYTGLLCLDSTLGDQLVITYSIHEQNDPPVRQ